MRLIVETNFDMLSAIEKADAKQKMAEAKKKIHNIQKSNQQIVARAEQWSLKQSRLQF